MQSNRLGLRATLAIFTVALFVTSSWAATHQVLHSFNPNGADGAFSDAGLIADAAGNRYGTTYEGGTYNVGTVFELSPNGSGGWTETVLYNFDNNGRDGINPQAGLTLDANGNLYGTTPYGGIHAAGTVFELSPQQGGGWTEKVLHSFNSNGTDGATPYAQLIFDAAGNLYGTSEFGGIYYSGTVFELSPRQGGSWTETVLHSFGNGTDGAEPFNGVIADGAGNLYGTTVSGGLRYQGTVFELSPRQGGGWTETVLHSFGNGTDGAQPFLAALIRDTAGNLYGTTQYGGIHNFGTVFELTPQQGGGWTETILHSFGNGTDGTYPIASLILDAAGNLYGTTYSGGLHVFGTVFELSPRQGGGWTESLLHSFNLNGTDGAQPNAGLILDGLGNLYSTTAGGGMHSVGTVLELAPRQGGGWTETVLYSFDFNGADGAEPGFAGLISDSAGNFYGTTAEGGTYDAGIAFELMPTGGGGWTEKVLHNFGRDTDGTFPDAGLIFDAAGNLYGTTLNGGIHGYGTVFELTPSGGIWTERVLHSFNVNGSDGALPFSGLVFDRFGNLYGTTYYGGIHNCFDQGCGTVFELMPNGSGGWAEKVLHSFNDNGTDGSSPYAGLTLDAAGNLYGTTPYGGISDAGTAFELTPNGSGGWTQKVLHNFNFNGTDGVEPFGGLIFDAANNLYGTTIGGGIHEGGTIFQLTPHQNGSWSERVLHSFNGADGAGPQGVLVRFGSLPDLYGTTYAGGVNNLGTVFELTPTQGGTWIETVLHNFSPTGGDGTNPSAGLIFDTSSNLYGMTSAGGTYNSGTVFEVGP